MRHSGWPCWRPTFRPIAARWRTALGLDGAGVDGAGADRIGGMLVANTEAAWFDALCHLIRDTASRQRLAAGARTAFAARHTLAAQATARRAAWLDLAAGAPAAIASPRRRPVRLAAD